MFEGSPNITTVYKHQKVWRNLFWRPKYTKSPLGGCSKVNLNLPVSLSKLAHMAWKAKFSYLISNTCNEVFDVQLSGTTFLAWSIRTLQTPGSLTECRSFAEGGVLDVIKISVQTATSLKMKKKMGLADKHCYKKADCTSGWWSGLWRWDLQYHGEFYQWWNLWWWWTPW